MLTIAGVLLIIASLIGRHGRRTRERYLEGAELQALRRFDDQVRKELIHPFDWQ